MRLYVLSPKTAGIENLHPVQQPAEVRVLLILRPANGRIFDFTNDSEMMWLDVSQKMGNKQCV